MKFTQSLYRLDTFLSGQVRDIVCYKDGIHEYLLMCVHLQDKRIPLVWIRTERHPIKSSVTTRMSSQAIAAMDTIKLSYDRSKLWASEDDNMMASVFSTLQFRHVVELLNIVHDVSRNYGVTGLNCMWYAAVVLGTLQGEFGRVWVNPPKRDWVKTALKLFGKDTKKATLSVEQRFLPRSPGSRRISLMDAEAWNAERLSPNPAPVVSLEQVSHNLTC